MHWTPLDYAVPKSEICPIGSQDAMKDNHHPSLLMFMTASLDLNELRASIKKARFRERDTILGGMMIRYGDLGAERGGDATLL
jgi:hypothetical protein